MDIKRDLSYTKKFNLTTLGNEGMDKNVSEFYQVELR